MFQHHSLCINQRHQAIISKVKHMQIEFEFEHFLFFGAGTATVLSARWEKAVLSLLVLWQSRPVAATSKCFTNLYCGLAGTCQPFFLVTCFSSMPAFAFLHARMDHVVWTRKLRTGVYSAGNVHLVQRAYKETLTTTINFGWHGSH